jgi:hypothetical protein
MKLRTSPLWWLGFGMTLKHENEELFIRKSFRKAFVNDSDLISVRIERRMFRGWTLVIETISKPIYFRMSKRQARKAKNFIESRYRVYSR